MTFVLETYIFCRCLIFCCFEVPSKNLVFSPTWWYPLSFSIFSQIVFYTCALNSWLVSSRSRGGLNFKPIHSNPIFSKVGIYKLDLNNALFRLDGERIYICCSLEGMSFQLVAFCFITVSLPFPNASSLKCVIDVACFSFNIGFNLGSFPSN